MVERLVEHLLEGSVVQRALLVEQLVEQPDGLVLVAHELLVDLEVLDNAHEQVAEPRPLLPTRPRTQDKITVQ